MVAFSALLHNRSTTGKCALACMQQLGRLCCDATIAVPWLHELPMAKEQTFCLTVLHWPGYVTGGDCECMKYFVLFWA